jgi:lipoprotein Spr
MKHFLFVSVAVGIFSGTSLNLKAQNSVNSLRSDFKETLKSSVKFIEGIELNQGDISSNGNLKIPIITQDRTFLETSPKPLSVKSVAIEKCSLLQFKYALLTNRDVESITNFGLYSFIEDWWATRYRYGGTTKKGVDCSAYVGTLLNEVYGFEMPRTARAQYGVCEKIDKEDLLEGDLVFFNTRGGVSHVGLYLGDGYFTHSSCSHGVTISNLQESYYSKKFIGGGRVNQ